MSSRPTKPLDLAIVGHTNVGKTSLMRTLMRDAAFGAVAPTSATTQQVEGARLLARSRPVVDLFDTPGLEDASALIERLEEYGGERHSGPERIATFIESPDASERFEQEARVLGQMLASDAALYVIDAREPVLGKYQDELAILALCARPILPVLNFVASPRNRSESWREALARVGLHAIAEFDTVVFSPESEARLWQRLATLAEAWSGALESLIEERENQAAWQLQAARALIAELLIDAAAARRIAVRGDVESIRRANRDLQQAIEQRERHFIEQMLGLFRFRPEDYKTVALPIEHGRWDRALFDPAMLGIFGRNTGSGLAVGAAAGAAVDVATGGLSLGAGTLIGALTGGGASALWHLRRDLAERVRGRISVMIDDAALGHLAARAQALLNALRQRGHAAQDPIELAASLPEPWPQSRLPGVLQKARLRPEVSSLNRGHRADAASRHELARELTGQINPG